MFVSSGDKEVSYLLQIFGVDNLQDFMEKVFGFNDLSSFDEFLPTEQRRLEKAVVEILNKNVTSHNVFLGEGYYPVNVPEPLIALVLRNPAWYSAYTPYQPEISQGRLELLYMFQEFFRFFSGHSVAVASLLDVGSAISDSVRSIASSLNSSKKGVYLASNLNDSVLAVLKNRLVNFELIDHPGRIEECFCFVASFPDKFGDWIDDPRYFEELNSQQLLGCAIVDPYFLIYYSNFLKKIPISIFSGSAQRLGVPLWGGGPYPAFLTAQGQLVRHLPGRIVSLTKDVKGRLAYRLALQTREQHIKKEKATSNVCTSQTLTALMVVTYLLLKGKEEIEKDISTVRHLARAFAESLSGRVKNKNIFDSVTFSLNQSEYNLLKSRGIYVYRLDDHLARVSFSPLHSFKTVEEIVSLLGGNFVASPPVENGTIEWPEIFGECKTELELQRYLHHLAKKDYTHQDGMIPLGSCTMKLNPSGCLKHILNSKWTDMHPFQPKETLCGLIEVLRDFEKILSSLTGFSSVTFHPNSGAQAELCALLGIRKYFNNHRNVVLIPRSAHGTNFSSASMAGFRIEVIECDENGGVSVDSLLARLSEQVACVMLTFPSTFGVFEDKIQQINRLIHDFGSFVYLDGANFNSFIGWLKPADLGFDICHINLHKTLAIPHGGGGPGAACLCYSEELSSVLPKNFFDCFDYDKVFYTNSSPWGNVGAILISYTYLKLLGLEGCRKVAALACLKANYLKTLLER
ncbi:MAG: aminotransferase class V-fold PLP-dependent enzyme, partial [Deltaproteobacteria bacterium]|nr:aminotransferase class V-fold PLP-dependent enzyme [Deltaproteobacteria bacterium]